MNNVFLCLKNLRLCCVLRKVAQIRSFCKQKPQRTVGEKIFLIAGLVAQGRKRRSISLVVAGCEEKLSFDEKLRRRRVEEKIISLLMIPKLLLVIRVEKWNGT